MKIESEFLDALRSAPGGYLSGAAFASSRGISRAALWKCADKLRRLGYVIEAHPRLGYRLVSRPDRMFRDEILHGLTTRVMGRIVRYFDRIDSTNDEAKRLGAQGWPEGTLVTTEEQTAGRGRMGRAWFSSPGGLFFSLIVRPELSLPDFGCLAVVGSAALARAIRADTGIEPAVKWPNDLVYDGRKLAGILAEANGELGHAGLVVIGVGLNVNQKAGDFPAALREKVISLRMILERDIRRVTLLQLFLREFEDLYQSGTAHGYGDVMAEVSAISATVGRLVKVTCGGGIVSGRALRLTDRGALVLETPSGEREFLSGDVEELRHAEC